MQGLLIKIFGALLVGFVYQYYYVGGDTFNFYIMITNFWEVFWDNPTVGWELFNIEANDYSKPHLRHHLSGFYSWYYKEDSAFFVSKIGTIVSFTCFNSYTVIAMIFASISFIGMWSLYVTFYKAFPHLHKSFSYVILFIPSVWFWGSGVFKDTITMGCIGLSTYIFFEIVIHRNIKLINIILLAVSIYFTYRIKVYLAFCLLPAYLLTIFYAFKSKVNSNFIKKITAPLILLGTIFFTFQFVSGILEAGNSDVDQMISTIQNTQQWHSKISEEGKSYSLGEIEYTATGLLSKSFSAIQIALFEPYIWNANGPLLLASALENIVLLVLTIQTIILVRGRFFNFVNNDPYLTYSLSFSLLLAFIIGFTTYNYGALVRYKIPLIPFYLSSLVILSDVAKKKKANPS